ncbi:MAG: hypothetical protein RSE00_00935 [Clostridia bacterium]
MDNAQKAIMIGVGLFITILVIAAVMLITGLGQDMLNKGKDEAENVSSSLQAQLTADYDGNTRVTGSQVIAAVKRYYTDPNLTVTVNNVVFNNTATGAGRIGNLTSTVNPGDLYTSTLTRNGTGNNVTGITFTSN